MSPAIKKKSIFLGGKYEFFMSQRVIKNVVNNCVVYPRICLQRKKKNPLNVQVVSVLEKHFMQDLKS